MEQVHTGQVHKEQICTAQTQDVYKRQSWEYALGIRESVKPSEGPSYTQGS